MHLATPRLLLLGTVLCLAACRSANGDGDRARKSGGNSFSSTEFILKDSRLSEYRIGYNGADRKRMSTRKLTPDELAAFWKELEETGVYRWRPRYELSGPAPLSDPGSWDITIWKGGKQVFQSVGYGAFPSDADPRKTTSFKTTDRYLQVSNLFQPNPRNRARLAPLNAEEE